MTIRLGDCTKMTWEGDVLITDPPYRAHVHKNATSQSIGGGTRHRELGFDSLTEELRAWTCHLAAAVARWGCIFTDIESIGDWIAGLKAAKAAYIRAIPWVRWSMPQLSGDRPPQGAEFIIIAYGKGKGKKHWNGPGNLTHFAHTCLRGDGKHKCEKPLDLMLDLVNWFSDEGETVLDPFAGSGTTSLACTLLKRKFTGAEIDDMWYSKAIDRRDIRLPRDEERYNRWVMANKVLEAANEKRRAHTAKVRAKLDGVV